MSYGMGAAIGGIGGALIGSSSAKSINEDMIELSNTKYQRGVEDMRKAGLNPMLMATGGSSASAAVPKLNNPGESAAKIGQGLVNSALAVRSSNIKKDLADASVAQAEADTANKVETNNLIKAQQDKVKADTAVSLNTAQKIAQDNRASESKTDIIGTGYDLIRNIMHRVMGDNPVATVNDAIDKPKPKSKPNKTKVHYADERPRIWERDYKQKMKTYNYIQGLRK